jgi:hypothetical protein
MVEVQIADGQLVVEVQGWDKLWALKSRLEIPLAHVRAARMDLEAARGWFHGLRLPGTEIPGVITAGTFYQAGEFVFFDVHDPDRTVVIELSDDERYKRLIVEVEHPDQTVAIIQRAIAERGP